VRKHRARVRVVPKVVPQRGVFVAGVVPHNPKVGSDNHAARRLRVVASRLLPSRVVLYGESMAQAAPTMYLAEIASGREPEVGSEVA
jgi:hypothetical protein